MCRFSIIVPLLDNLHQFEDSLASVLRYRPVESQIIVVHDGSYSDPYHLTDEVQMVQADRGSNLTGLLNVGMCYVAGEYTVVVRPGVEVDESWHEPVEDAFSLTPSRIGSVTPVIASASAQNRIVTAGIRHDRSFTRTHVGANGKITARRIASLEPTGPTIWLAAYRSSILKAVGPFDESMDPVYLDLEIALSMKSLGFKTSLSTDFVGLVDSRETICQEQKQPHGCEAQRAKLRHQAYGSSSFLDWIVELAQAPFAGWKLKHLAQRFCARQFRSVDSRYARTLQQIGRKQPWLDKHPDSESESLPSPVTARRAA